MNLISELAKRTSLSEEQARLASEVLLEMLHKRLVEYKDLNGNYLGDQAHYELPYKAYYHLLGFVERFSKCYLWSDGIICKYLMLLPPINRWTDLAREIADWKWQQD